MDKYKYIKNLAKEGYRFFPCYENKKPATKNGFYDATNDIEQLDQMFNDEKFLVGFPCGEINNNIVVLDVDQGKEGDTRTVDELLDELEEILNCKIPRDGFKVQTQNGGLHLYFKAPDGVKIRGGTRPFHKTLSIDLLSNGKYAIFPDNIKYFVYDSDIEIEDFYNHLPPLSEEIINFRKEHKTTISNNEYLLPDQEVIEIQSALDALPIDVCDNHDSWIDIGLCLNSTKDPRALNWWDQWSQKSKKYNKFEIDGRWKSFHPREITIASLFHEASKYGWKTTYKKESILQSCEEKNLSDILIKKEERLEFPTELLIPPGFVGELAEYITSQAVKEQPIFSLATSICVVATLAGQKVQTKTGIRPNVYCVSVGKSGCGKDSPRKTVKKIFHYAGIGELSSVEDIASDAAIVTNLSENPSQLFLLDEIGRLIKTLSDSRNSHLYNVSTMFLKMYSSADATFYGKIYADGTQKTIEQPNLCIYGTTVPSTLYEGLKKSDIENGLLSRMLIFETTDQDPEENLDKNLTLPPPGNIIKKINQLNDKKINQYPDGNLDHRNPQPQIVEMNSNAIKMLKTFKDEVRKERKMFEEMGDDASDTIMARIIEYSIKIALIVASGVNIDNPMITEIEMDYSIKLMKYLSKYMLRLCRDDISENEHESKMKKVLTIIRKSGTISLSDLGRKTKGIRRIERNDILDTLMEHDEIDVAYEPIENSRKRTKYYYFCGES